jgi:putative DNA primase/helicase
MLLRAQWEPADADMFVEHIAKAAGDADWKDRLKAQALSTSGKHVPGLPALRELIGRTTADLVAEWIGAAGYKETVATTHPFTHTGLADGFAARYGDDLRYVTNLGKWFQWDGCRWRRDDGRNALDLFSAIARSQVAEVDSAAMLVPAKVLGLRRELLSRGYREGGESIARTMPRFTVSVTALDAHSYLLNTPDGTIDLRTGKSRPHRREDLLTKCTAVAPADTGIEDTRFEKFLIEITSGDKKLIEYLRVGLGACLIGANADGISGDHWLLFLVGVGRNGKTTLMELVLKLMGDYAKVVAGDLLMATAHGDSRHPTEIANLLGVRLALCSEVEEGARWAENKLKLLTGDGELSARFMRQDAFEFPKTHHLVICGNHRPLITNVDVAIKSRLHIVPFKVCFAGREDAGLPAALQAEAPQVLRWLISGATDYFKARKLDRCEAVEKESEDYFTSQATFDLWLSERTKLDSDVRCLIKDLYSDYRAWKEERGEGVTSQTRWGEEMGRRFERVSATPGRMYVGVRLLFSGPANYSGPQ